MSGAQMESPALVKKRRRGVLSPEPPPRERERRVPTYGAATRLARIVHGLSSRPHGWGFTAIQNELRISERTLMRYLAVCRRELTDAAGRPLIEMSRRGSHRMVRLARSEDAMDSTAYEVAFLYFALTVFQFLEGTVLQQGIEGLWDRLYVALPEIQRVRLPRPPQK